MCVSKNDTLSHIAVQSATQTASTGDLNMKTTLLISAICLLILAPIVLPAQVTTTTMFGTVSDKTGAVVVGPAITATNTTTNLPPPPTTNHQRDPPTHF